MLKLIFIKCLKIIKKIEMTRRNQNYCSNCGKNNAHCQSFFYEMPQIYLFIQREKIKE